MKKVLMSVLMVMTMTACNNVDAEEEHKLYDGNVTPEEAEIMKEAHEEYQQQSDYTACDKAADGTAYVIEDNAVVETFQTNECKK